VHTLGVSLEMDVAWRSFMGPPQAQPPRRTALAGVGMQLLEDRGTFVVQAIAPWSSLRGTVVEEGSELMAVDGQPVAGLRYDAVLRLVQGRPGTTVMLDFHVPMGGIGASNEILRSTVESLWHALDPYGHGNRVAVPVTRVQNPLQRDQEQLEAPVYRPPAPKATEDELFAAYVQGPIPEVGAPPEVSDELLEKLAAARPKSVSLPKPELEPAPAADEERTLRQVAAAYVEQRAAIIALDRDRALYRAQVRHASAGAPFPRATTSPVRVRREFGEAWNAVWAAERAWAHGNRCETVATAGAIICVPNISGTGCR